MTRKSIVPTPPPTRPKPVPVPPKPAAPFDPKKMMIGAKVRHKAFGEGTVIKSDGRIITVEFNGDAQGMVQKKFAFPGAFQDGFLSFID